MVPRFELGVRTRGPNEAEARVSGLQLVVLALVQGLTEFLPISSSAHLILVPIFTDWPDQGPAIDVAVHVGTLGAAVIYFRRDLWLMLGGLRRLGAGGRDPGARLALHVAVATVPVVIAGAALSAVGPGGAAVARADRLDDAGLRRAALRRRPAQPDDPQDRPHDARPCAVHRRRPGAGADPRHQPRRRHHDGQRARWVTSAPRRHAFPCCCQCRP